MPLLPLAHNFEKAIKRQKKKIYLLSITIPFQETSDTYSLSFLLRITTMELLPHVSSPYGFLT